VNTRCNSAESSMEGYDSKMAILHGQSFTTENYRAITIAIRIILCALEDSTHISFVFACWIRSWLLLTAGFLIFKTTTFCSRYCITLLLFWKEKLKHYHCLPHIILSHLWRHYKRAFRLVIRFIGLFYTTRDHIFEITVLHTCT
jgi:hypothetical protein